MPTVTFTSKGYPGTIQPGSSWARAKLNGGGTYGVLGSGHWRPTIKPGADRTAVISAGSGSGAGIDDTTDIDGEVTFGTLTSGTRYDLIVVRRTWGSTNASSFAVIPGSSSRALPTRNQTPGTLDDQPIGLARITGGTGGGVLAEIIPLRVWQVNGGAVAEDDLCRSYLTNIGTVLHIGDVVWTRGVDDLSNPVWSKAPQLTNPLAFLAGGFSLAGGVPPVGAQFSIQAGTAVLHTSASGYAEMDLPVPFPNGLLTAGVWNGDDLVPVGAQVAMTSTGPTRSKLTWGLRNAAGTRLGNTQHRVNWFAIGW